MNFSQLKYLLAGLGLVILLTFLFVKTKALDPEKHIQVTVNLVRLRELDATLNQEILKNKTGLLLQYDTLVSTLKEIKRRQHSLMEGAYAIFHKGKKEMDQNFEAYTEVLAKKEELIEYFKSDNVVFKNSLNYFPIAIEELITYSSENDRHTGLTPLLQNILNDISSYTLVSSEKLRLDILAEINELLKKQDQLPPAVRDDLDIIVTHARTILKQKGKVDALVKKIVSMPSAPHIDKLFQTYQMHYEEALRHTNLYRIYLYLFSVISLACIGYVMLRFRDIASTLQIEITERKKAEKELSDALKENTDFLNAIPDIAYQFNPDLSIAKWNFAMEDSLGYSSEEISGMKAFDFFSKEDREKAANAIQEVFEKGQSVFEAQVIAKDGNRIPCLFSGRAVKDSEGNILKLTGVAKNLTKILQAEEEKRNLEENLQRSQKMESLGVLAGGVAHDLNNVLSGILSYPELILLNLPENHKLRKPIETIKKAGQRASEIVEDLLTLARRGVPIKSVLNLNDLIKECVSSPEHIKTMSFHSGVHVKTSLEDNLLNIKGSSIHIKKTILNLVSNAAEAQPEGGEIILLTENRSIDQLMKGYDNIPEGDYAVFKVEDKGHGISKDDLRKIFEPFYTKKIMGRSGTGLGMAVVWGTVKDHRGHINVKSVDGEGTTFELYFPTTREGSAEEEGFLLEDYIGKGQSILVVDDIEEQRDIASLILEKLGYKPFTVSSGEEAVEYMKDNSVDLLVLDMIMYPGIDGLETYKKILELHPDQKAIIASGFSETNRVKEAQKIGAGKYIKKPYTLKKIAMVVKAELNK